MMREEVPVGTFHRSLTMHRSFGIETRRRPACWDEAKRGPTLAEVRKHIHKVANYRTIFAEPRKR
jgi:hypothetical protein